MSEPVVGFPKSARGACGGGKNAARILGPPNESDDRANAGNNPAYQKKEPEIELGAGIRTGESHEVELNLVRASPTYLLL